MLGVTNNTEYLLAHKAAEEYRSKGYEVSLEAPLYFFPDFQADLLVQKGDEAKVIEVKSRSSLAANPKISELARIIDSMPGWSFELLLVGEPEKLDSPHSFESVNARQRIEEAEKALQAGLPEAAFLLAWSAHEAATRELIAGQGVSDPRITTPRHVLDQAVYSGVISGDEYNSLTEMLKYRNAIIHGFSPSDFSAELATKFVETTQRAITDTPQS